MKHVSKSEFYDQVLFYDNYVSFKNVSFKNRMRTILSLFFGV